MYVITYVIAARYIPVISGWGMAKDHMRKSEMEMGGHILPVMMEEPPVWET
jgi:hypothetical protein